MSKYSFQCLYVLDIEAMNQAAEMLLGTHDFRCFQKTGTDVKTSVCTVTEAGWHSYTPTHCSVMDFPCKDGDYLYFRICADRFLRNMVRAVVGSLLDVGRGKMTQDQFAKLILPQFDAPQDGPSRGDAGESVPGHALFLSSVNYAKE